MTISKILIIDDDPTTCSLLETVLQMEDYETVSSNDVEDDDIIALIEKTSPHFIVLDYNLGSTETLKYITDIRASKAWADLPVIMTSGMDRKRECLEAGANEFLLKPFDYQEVAEQINKLSDK